MKYLIVILSAILFSQNCYPQKLKTQKKITQLFKEIYQVDKKSKLKNGFYYKLSNSTKDTLVVGQYLNNEKSGIWKYQGMFKAKYFDYNYDTNTILEIYDNELKLDSAYVFKGSKFELDVVDHPQIYLGHKEEAQAYLARTIKLPNEIAKNGIEGRSAASFVIDSKGKLINPKIEFSLHKDMDETIIDLLTNMKGTWIPALKDGVNVASKIILIVDVGENGMGEVKKTSYIWQLRVMYYGTTVRRRKL